MRGGHDDVVGRCEIGGTRIVDVEYEDCGRCLRKRVAEFASDLEFHACADPFGGAMGGDCCRSVACSGWLGVGVGVGADCLGGNVGSRTSVPPC